MLVFLLKLHGGTASPSWWYGGRAAAVCSASIVEGRRGERERKEGNEESTARSEPTMDC